MDGQNLALQDNLFGLLYTHGPGRDEHPRGTISPLPKGTEEPKITALDFRAGYLS